MRFRVLGPLHVDDDGSVLPSISALMMRRLLAALLSRPNTCVGVEDLLRALWGEDPPPSGRKTLRVYVRRLRSALGDDKRIISEPAGYRIVVHAGDLDATDFLQLVAEAESAPEQHAATLLKDALGLWRGAAFEDVREHAPITDEARRLDEERLRVEAWHVQLQLELGRHAELVPHLTKLAEEHPYREDFRRHLMLALYRCSRQTDALELFRETRRLLNDELGVEPGPELQQLHEAILRGDPSLSAPKRSTASVPRQLPADIYGFVGRDEQLSALDETLHDVVPVVISAIAGSAGVGKTALAVHWSHSVADRFPDGQLYVNLRGFDPVGSPVKSTDAIRRFLDALGVAPQRIPTDFEEQVALYRSLLADRRILVLLDNARDAEQVRPLLPGSRSSLAVVTSRNRLISLIATSGAQPLMLDVLTEAEGRRLLIARLGEDRVTAGPEAAEDIINSCARLPLALAVVAARAATDPHVPLRVLAAELRTPQGKLDAFNSDDPITDLHAVFSWSYQQLTPRASRLFRLLGLHPGPDISAPAAASLAGVRREQVQPLLVELTDAHLVAKDKTGRYAFHDLLRAYANDLVSNCETQLNRSAALRRAIEYYLHTANDADRLLQPYRDPLKLAPPQPGTVVESPADGVAAMAWFQAEHQVLLAIVRHAAAVGLDTLVPALARTLRTFLDRQGHWDDWADTYRLVLASARREGDVREQAIAYRNLASTCARVGNYEEAKPHLQHAMELFQQTEDEAGQADTYYSLTWVLQQQAKYADALHPAQQALELYRASGNEPLVARTMNTIGWIHAQLGEFERAFKFTEEAMIMHQRLSDPDGQAANLDSLAYIYQNLGKHSQAIRCYQDAVALFHKAGNLYLEADTLAHLGDTFCALGDREQAGEIWLEALTLLTELSHPDAERISAKLEMLRR